jgi:hypothetical protein
MESRQAHPLGRLVATCLALTMVGSLGGITASAGPAAAPTTEPAAAPSPAPTTSQGAPSGASEIHFDVSLIQDFVRVAFFGKEGRVHFKEYTACNYEFLQNPRVEIQNEELVISAEYWRRLATPAGSLCVGGPGSNVTAVMHARPYGSGRTLGLEVTRITTQEMPGLTEFLLSAAGVTVPTREEFDLMSILNTGLHGRRPFGILSLDIHEVRVEATSLVLTASMQLGVW